jgi:hypothetical protein
MFFSSGRRRGAIALAALTIVGSLLTAATTAASVDALLFRIFLRDGSSLVSYGDFARVADRVVFSIPVAGVDGPSPTLHLVNISESAVDWERTDRYAAAVRARNYAATRGEADFDALSTEVARVLNAVGATKDPARRLSLANEARRMLANWPAAHFGYRASDVKQLSDLLDEAVSELRAAAGQSRFDLELVATASPLPANVPALPAPTLRESIEQAFAVATITPDSTERVSLLQTVLASLQQIQEPAAWTSALKSTVSAELAAELSTDKKYGTLVTKTIAAADTRAREADVAGIEALVGAVLRADDKLGRQRPDVTAALLATLDGRLNAARRLRLARDAWVLRRRAVGEYERRIRSSVERFRRSTSSLEQIRQLAGPKPEALPSLAERVSVAWRDLKLVKPPAEAEAVHGMFISAVQMAVRAASSRRLAISAADMNTAWEASSAAAGALMMFERARDELRKLSVPPGL